MSPRSLLAFATLCVTACALLLTATPAFAREFHAFSTSFGSAGSGNGQLALASNSGLAVNSETGDIYVADTGNARVEEFEADGTFVRTFAVTDPTFIAIDNSGGGSKGDVYVADSVDGTVSKFEPDGTLVSAWGTGGQLSGSGELDGIAVNPSGDLYVLRGSAMTVLEPGGTQLETFSLRYGAAPTGIAVNAAGEIYTRWESQARTLHFDATGELIDELFPPPTEVTTGLAVDPANGNVYLDQPTEVAAYSASSELIETFGSPHLEEGAGIAVGSSHTVYLADAGNERVDVFPQVPGVAIAVSLKGSGSGVVTSEPSGIECGSTCATELPQGTAVTLTATPNERSTFTGWTVAGHSGACQGTGTCEVQLSEAASVEAEFTATPQLKLTVAVEGKGVVTTSPGPEFTPIECGNGAEVCEAEYNEGATLILTATPTERSTFSGWTVAGHPGTCPGTGTCEVNMTEAKSVKAEFAAIPQQKLIVATEGPGTVTDVSPGPEFTAIDCGNGATTCEAEYNEGAKISLTSIPGVDYHFSSWAAGGCDLTSGNECVVTMGGARSVKAEFLPTIHKLTVAISGSGSVTSSPPGILCEEGSCEAEYQEGDTITLTAHPASHKRLAAWGAGECTFEPSPTVCEVEIGKANAKVETEFAPIQRDLVVTSDGGGAVSATSGAISGCAHAGGVCSGEYDEASTVTLVASPFAHAAFKVWGAGECKVEPEEGKCEVEIGSATAEVTAEFAPIKHVLTVAPSGAGTISANSGPIKGCESGGGTCAGEYVEASTVTLTAAPAPNQMVAWTGCVRTSAESCEVEVGTFDTLVHASFVPVAHALFITRAGTGSGSVTCNGGSCAAAYPDGSTLILGASPSAGSTFAGWSGAGCAGTGACELTLRADATITANFSANPPPPIEEKCAVPQLAGKTLNQARSALGAAHCSLGTVTKPKPKKHHKLGPLLVKSSAPAAGITLPAASKVDLTLGPKPGKHKH